MSQVCQQCGAASPAGTSYCGTCGAVLAGAGVPGPPPHAVGSGSGVSSDSRNLGLLAHLSAFVTFAGVPSFVGPLVVWLWKRDQDPFVAEHAREALNFNLSVLLYAVVGAVIAVAFGFLTLGLGFLLVVPVAIALAIAFLVIVVLAGLAASRGEGYRYPVTIRFVR
jgi:uncharacterized protein